MSIERAKLQMRLEQLENPSFFHEIKDEIERTQQDIQNLKTMNNRLALEQNTIVDQIQKYTDTYKSDENAALKSIKFIKDETSRITLQIYDKEKDLET